jgi:hypothetical protein
MFTNDLTARRGFLSRSGQLTLSAAAIGLLAGTRTANAQSSMSMEADVGILNVALGLEHEAISAYQLGAGSGLLQKPVLDVAVAFQSHHKAHRDALIATIQTMGGRPVAEKVLDDYAKALNAASLKSQADVLMLAAKPGQDAALRRAQLRGLRCGSSFWQPAHWRARPGAAAMRSVGSRPTRPAAAAAIRCRPTASARGMRASSADEQEALRASPTATPCATAASPGIPRCSIAG